MANNYYNFTNSFVPGTKVRSDDMNNELDGITAGFDELPNDASSINTGTTFVGTESGSANAYVVDRVNPQTSYDNGDHVGFFATHTNTDSSTINIDGLGIVSLVSTGGASLVDGDLQDGVYYEAVFDSANNHWQLISPTTSTLAREDLRVDWAEEWAINPEDTLVSTDAGGNGTTDYSSLHWAAKSSDSAAAAEASAVAAATPASETVAGAVELATQAEVDAGTDTTRVLTPATAKSRYAVNQSASETVEGIVELATQAEVDAGSDTVRAIVPATLKSRESTRGVFVNNSNYNSNVSDNAITISSVVTVGTWEGVGPTDSGADNIWTALDAIPLSADWVELKIRTSASGTATTVATSLYARSGDGAQSTGLDNIISNVHMKDGDADTKLASNYTTVKVPVNAANVFDAHWVETGSGIVQAWVAGYGWN